MKSKKELIEIYLDLDNNDQSHVLRSLYHGFGNLKDKNISMFQGKPMNIIKIESNNGKFKGNFPVVSSNWKEYETLDKLGFVNWIPYDNCKKDYKVARFVENNQIAYLNETSENLYHAIIESRNTLEKRHGQQLDLPNQKE